MLEKFYSRGKSITILGQREHCRGIVYLHGNFEPMDRWDVLVEQRKLLLVGIDGVDWNRELSPWPAERVFRGGEDFAGEAEAYLRELCTEILPQVESRLGIGRVERTIAGYSMAGLFAGYVGCRCDCFDRVASLSGSLWFDGFTEYLEKTTALHFPERMYFSLGDREKNTRNPRMAQVEEKTIYVVDFFRRHGVRTQWEQSPGGHFDRVPERIFHGIEKITEE